MHLHLRLQLILQDAIKFLHVMLQERVQRRPSERLRQFGSTCGNGEQVVDSDQKQSNIPTG